MCYDLSINELVDRQENISLMNIALGLAEESLKSKDVPVGAVIVRNGEIIGQGYNCIEKTGNPLNHAEIIAINQAVQNIGHKHLLNCKMYVTLEPCSMCAGAIVLARIPKLIIGTADPKTGACGSLFNIVQDERLNHRCKIENGVLEEECSALLKKFFRDVREQKKRRWKR
jgi:tRNA(adenine34) deaminase